MKRIPEQIWVFAGSFIFFLLSLAENFSGPHDSITYLNGIVDGYPLVNQHHLLYHYSAYIWLHTWQPIFPGAADYYIIETFSAVWGSCSLAVVYSFFRNRFKRSVTESIAGMLPVAFSYAFWFYSVNIEVYAPPLFFILLALYFLTKEILSTADWWRVIVLHVLAILFHQINSLFVVVIIFRMWQQRKYISFPRWMVLYSLTGTFLVGGAYFIVGWIIEQQNSFVKWVSWMKGYAGGSEFWYPLGTKTLVDVSYGYSHSMLGGHFVFQLAPVKNILKKSLAAHSLSDELFIARNISSGMAVFLTILTVILFIVVCWLLVRFIKNFRTIRNNFPSVIVPLILTFFIYSAFFTFWMPEILEFWILQSVLTWLLLLGTLPAVLFGGKIKQVFLYGMIGGLLFCINYFGSIRWMEHKENDLYYVKTIPLKSIVKENDFVILQDGWILKDFLSYFTKLKIQAVPPRDSSQSALSEKFMLTLAGKGSVFILPEINNKFRAPDTQYIDSLRKQYSSRITLIRSKDPEIWMIE